MSYASSLMRFDSVVNVSPVLTNGVGVITSSRMSRSGLKSPGATYRPPREVNGPASAPPSATTAISPNPFRGPTARASFTWRYMPSRLSQKSIPFFSGSVIVRSSTEPVESLSMISVGGVRPPSPTSVTGRALPAVMTAKVALPIWVIVKLFPPAPPGRNSLTVPSTSTWSPTAGFVPLAPRKTKMPSLVASSPSGSGSVIQKPWRLTAVTMPSTPKT